MKRENGFSIIILSLIAITLLSSRISAQLGMAATIPFTGYVVLANGDTLHGQIKWSLKYVENNPVEITFYDKDRISKKYNAGEIKGFSIIIPGFAVEEPLLSDNEYQDYVSVLSFKKNTPVFMLRLLVGRLTVYENRSSISISSSNTIENSRIDGIQFTWSPGEGLFIGPSYKTDYRKIEGRIRFTSYFVSKENKPIIKIEKKNYQEYFDLLFKDSQAIEQELAKNQNLNKFKNFMILAEIYNCIYKSE